MSQRDEISSNRRNKKPLIFVAVGAIFLCGALGFGVKTLFFSSGASQEVSLLSPSPYSHTSQEGVFSAQYRFVQDNRTETPNLLFVDNASLKATVPTMAVTPQVLGSITGEAGATNFQQTQEITHYVVEEGDTVEALAERFDISTNTILWANELSSSASLEPGEELVILPVSGALHLVRPADTLSEIALWYEGNIEEILAFNNVDSAQDIYVGDILIIPHGKKPASLPNGRLTPVANSYFIYPVPRSYEISQGLHPFNAVDFASGACGGPAYAAAGGTVQLVGYHNIAGNYVRILHSNGVVTFYGHLSGQTVTSGERVHQGQTIGYIGHSGKTIPAGPGGCHLHFEVRGATNPFQ